MATASLNPGARFLAKDLAEILLSEKYGESQGKLIREKTKGFRGDLGRLVQATAVEVADLFRKNYRGKRPSRKELEGIFEVVVENLPEWEKFIQASIEDTARSPLKEKQAFKAGEA